MAKNSPLVRLQAEIFDPAKEYNKFLKKNTGAGGAAICFTGLVRSTPDNPIIKLTLEHYPALAQKQLEKFANIAFERFKLQNISLIHRYGEMAVGEPIVQVMTVSAHRQAAFDGANYIMDWLKTDAPFWKIEQSAKGKNWVENKACDEGAKHKWKTD